MMKKKYILAYLIVFLASSIFCQTQTCLQNLDHPGFKSLIQISSSDTISREYILHVPANYDTENASPLVINMHGFGDCASNFSDDVGELYELNDQADEENFFVAYPQGAYRPIKEDTYWEPGDNGSLNIYENDVYFMEQLIVDISSEFNIDMNKIYAMGYSNGGMMAYSLACNRSDLFAGIGIMSGIMLEEDCSIENSVPIIKFHGIEDEVLPYAGSFFYQSVSDVVNFWLDQNEIPQSSLTSTELNEGKVVRDEYFVENENSCLTLYTVYEEWGKPGGHVWFSEEINGSSPNEKIWDFFTNGCTEVTSISEYAANAESINVYPNPFHSQLNIEAEFTSPQIFKIYNMLGELEFQGTLDNNIKSIELDFLRPNIYILQVGEEIKKLIKSQ